MPRCEYWYRLMILRPNGRIVSKASGSLIYLRRLAAQAKPGARQWIEMNLEPATLPAVAAARRPLYHHGFQPALTRTVEPAKAGWSSIGTRPYGSATVVPIEEERRVLKWTARTA